jgi:ABC-type phosphate transport system substrate-binding protein
MLNSRLGKVASGAFAATLALSVSVGTAATLTRPAAHSGVAPSKAAGLVTVPSEGGTLAAIVYRGWMDYYGLAIPGDTQGGPNGPLDAGAQFIYGAVGTGAAQNDTANQQSGWNDTVPNNPPNFNGSPVYGGQADTFVTTCPSPNPHDVAQCGYQPTAAKALEPRDGTTKAGNSNTPDSLVNGAGDAPFDLAELSTYNNSNGQASGYNLQRGPLVQTPLIATAISVPFNSTGLVIPSGGIRLSRNSMCGIFQGLITNWNDPSITNDNNGTVIGNQPLTIVHRSDGSGTTFIFSYDMYVVCSQSNVNTQYVWTQGVGTASQNGGNPANNTVTWPVSSIGEKGSGAVADYVAQNSGTIAYLSPSYVARAGGNEAFVQNAAGGFVQATVAATKAAIGQGPFVKANQTSQIPPGYPYLANTYLPLPSASGSAPFVGYTFGYFYSCSPQRQQDQLSKLKGYLKWALAPQDGGGLTPADSIAETNGLVELPDKAPKAGGASKQATDKAVKAVAAYANSHSGTYIDPTSGNTLNYTCTPAQ